MSKSISFLATTSSSRWFGRPTLIAAAGTLIAISVMACSESKNSSSTLSSTKDAGLSIETTVAMEEMVESVLASLTLEQKVSQMIQGEIAHVTPEDVRQYGLGSVLNGGGSFPQGNKHATVGEWLALADAYGY